MRRGQLIVLAVAAIAVAAVALLARGGSSDKGDGADRGRAAAGPAVRVPFAYSPEKADLLVPLVRDFNASGTQVGGRRVVVEARSVASGEAADRIAAGRLRTVAWSPASSLWGRLANFQADRRLVGDSAPSIARTPLVIAMWEPMARALGWPRKQIGFKEIVALARSRQGWARFGHPEFGRFKLVHTNPDFSTSGLSAVVAEYYAATGKKEGLLERDVRGTRARRVVRDIERSIVHYGDTTLFIAGEMRRHGPGYASAVAMEEATLLDFNRSRGPQPRLVALYPPEGTFFSDNPFYVLDAGWVDAGQAAGARAFQRFLSERVTGQLAARFGFRPAAPDAAPAPPITAANGVDPRKPARALELPEPRVLAAIKRSWRADRKPASILLVLDTSGSMASEGRLERAKQGLAAFLREVGDQDSVGLTTFSERIHPLVPIAPVQRVRGELRQTVQGLVADGGTAFYDATVAAFDALRARDEGDRIKAVVLLTDGQDTDSTTRFESVVQRLEAQGDSENRVRVFTIAYSPGASAARGQLDRIALAAGGKGYQGSTDDIETVYRSISSFF